MHHERQARGAAAHAISTGRLQARRRLKDCEVVKGFCTARHMICLVLCDCSEGGPDSLTASQRPEVQEGEDQLYLEEFTPDCTACRLRGQKPLQWTSLRILFVVRENSDRSQDSRQ